MDDIHIRALRITSFRYKHIHKLAESINKRLFILQQKFLAPVYYANRTAMLKTQEVFPEIFVIKYIQDLSLIYTSFYIYIDSRYLHG